MKTLFVYSLCLLGSFQLMADPTRPPADWQAVTGSATAQSAAVSQLQLQLIKDTAQGKTALINGQLLYKGQKYQHYLVTDISATQVILESNGQRHVLSLLNTAIKQYD